MSRAMWTILCVFFVVQCNGSETTNPFEASGDESAWEDSRVVVAALHLGSNEAAETAPADPPFGTGDRVYFRSSDSELWSISEAADFESIVSAKYDTGATFAEGRGLEYVIGDDVESIVFEPYTDVNTNLCRPDLNPGWPDYLSAFIEAGNSMLNFIRLDIGDGGVTFEIGGEQVDMRCADGSDCNGIDGNSILFIDKAMLKEPLIISRDVEEKIVTDAISAEDLGLNEDEFAIVSAIHKSSNEYDSVTPIDVNGALYIPTTPVDISGFDPDVNHLVISVSWPIENAVHVRNGEYYMDDRVSSTAFDFSVELQIVDGPPPE